MRSLAIAFLFFAAVLGVLAQPPKSKPNATKPKPTATPVKAKPNEKAAWEKAAALTDAGERVAACKKFLQDFPKTTRKDEALGLILAARSEIADAKLTAGDLDGTVAELRSAATEAPRTVPEKLWKETIVRILSTLFYRDRRTEALEIAKVLEEKVDGNADRLLSIADFYASVESGTDAKRVVEKAIVIAPTSSIAYQTLGFANRIDFNLEAAAAAYEKAVELDAESLAAKRGLAEMKRATGKPDEAVALYREMLAKDESNAAAKTGLVLSLFDADKRADAESEMAKLVESNSANFILLSGAAYWYAAHNDGERAVDLAQKAIIAEPQFVWSYIALARGMMLQKRVAEAEKTLFAARQYGSFPTLQYEMASARLAGGYYRDAADEIVKSFSIKDGVIRVKIGRRIERESQNFSELIGIERKASILTPMAADDPALAAKLAALLALRQLLDAAEPNAEALAKAADDLVAGEDKMKVHRQLFAASQLLEKRVALPKVLELTKAAAAGVEAGLDDPNSSTAVMASEVYDARMISATKGRYLIVPDIPRSTLSSIVRGRIEDINGWANFQLDNSGEAVTRLRRSVGVLPADSAWWRTAMWHLGTVLASTGKDSDALDAYIKVYKSDPPDAIRYRTIETLYKKMNGNTDGLEAKVGPDPAPPAPAATPEPTASPTPSPTPITEPTAEATPAPSPEKTPESVASPSPTAKEPQISKGCSISLSEETVTLASAGVEIGIIVGAEGDLEGVNATVSSPDNITIRREPMTGVKSRAIFIVSSPSGKAGTYTVTFELPCGKKELTVIVK